MKMNWKHFVTGMAAVMLLTACGTDTGNQTAEPVEDQPETETDGTANNSSDPVDEATDTDESAEDQEATDEASDRMADAVLTDSDAQDFSMYVLPEYYFTSEEPGRDILSPNDGGDSFMSIETMNADEGDYDALLENMKESLASVEGGSEAVEITDESKLPSSAKAENVSAYQTTGDEVVQTGILFEQDGLMVRLMIYDTLDEQHYDDYLHMGETIVKK